MEDKEKSYGLKTKEQIINEICTKVLIFGVESLTENEAELHNPIKVQEMLQGIAIKAIFKGYETLTDDEQIIYQKEIKKQSEKVNNESKDSELLLHKKLFVKWFDDLKEQTFETADSFLDYLIAEETAMPVLTKNLTVKTRGRKSRGNSGDWLAAKPKAPTDPTTQLGAIYLAVKNAGKEGITRSEIIKDMVKNGIKAGKAGYLYRVQNSAKIVNGKLVGWLSPYIYVSEELEKAEDTIVYFGTPENTK